MRNKALPGIKKLIDGSPIKHKTEKIHAPHKTPSPPPPPPPPHWSESA